VPTVFSRWAAEHPHETALADSARTLTWSALAELVNRVANGLRAAGLGEDGRVAIFAGNAVETVVAHLGAISGGVSSVAISRYASVDEVAYMLADAGAKVLLVGPSTVEVGAEAAGRAGVATVVGWGLPAGIVAPQGVIPFEPWVDGASAEPPPAGLPPRLLMLYTSGTTGWPKGTELPMPMGEVGRTVEEHLELRARLFPFGTKPHLVVGPLNHTGPLACLGALAGGAPVRVLEQFDPERVLQTIEAERIGSSLMVPTHFVRLLSLPEEVRRRYDVSSLEVVAHTGAACPPDVKRAMIDWWGPKLIDGYGATEVGVVTAITSAEWLERPGSVGRCTPQFEVLVVGDDGEDLPAGTVGRLFFRDRTGRGVVYPNDPDKTAGAHLAPGVFTLGDVGWVDEDGYVYITDRDVDMVISGGVNIYPAEVERVLADHPGVGDVAVFGVPSSEMGERLMALVQRSPGAAGTLSEAELAEFCRARLAAYKCPKVIEIVDDVGRNAMGKVNKRELRARYRAVRS
jgi:long-chain acyl-CoA synthetase